VPLTGVKTVNLLTGIKAGNQFIVPATLFSVNFNVQCKPGKVVIQQKQLTLKADDKIINFGDPLPEFTSVISGYAAGDSESNVFLPDASGKYVNYTPISVTGPGTYPIIPKANLNSPSDYVLHTFNGTLYVNPKGSGAKPVKPILECVEVVNASSNPGGYLYRARFSYQNDNSTTVCVPEADSRLTGTSFEGSPPRVFLPGRGESFYRYFDGNKFTWTITSNDGTRRSSVASVASSTSARCKTTSARIDYTDTESKEELSVRAYPNPVHDQLTINIPENDGQAMKITIFDAQGKPCLTGIPVNTTGAGIEMNVARLKPGMYLVRIDRGTRFELVRIIKK
jgi:hypothetical protein